MYPENGLVADFELVFQRRHSNAQEQVSQQLALLSTQPVSRWTTPLSCVYLLGGSDGIRAAIQDELTLENRVPDLLVWTAWLNTLKINLMRSLRCGIVSGTVGLRQTLLRLPGSTRATCPFCSATCSICGAWVMSRGTGLRSSTMRGCCASIVGKRQSRLTPPCSLNGCTMMRSI